MKKQYFIAGTDTEVGKTFVTTLLLDAFQQQGLSCLGLKPLAAGGTQSENGLQNEDALLLQQHASISSDYATINPIVLPLPVSPNIAAKKEGKRITANGIAEACLPGLGSDVDVVLVESCGGWFCPINETQTMEDVAIYLQLPVILVIGLRLGCLNHSVLTYHALQASGLTIQGWLTNEIEPDMLCCEENINTLKQFLTMPYLGHIAHGVDVLEPAIAMALS